MDKNQIIDILRYHDDLIRECKEKKMALRRELERLNNECDSDEKLRELYDKALQEILDEENKINYAWYFYLQLTGVQRTLLEELYVNQSGWEFAQRKLMVSKSNLCRQKEIALNRIVDQLDLLEGNV